MGEPAENPAGLKKRRRPWLIVALLLMLVSIGWHRLFGDGRYAGTWEIVTSGRDGYRATEVVSLRPGYTATYRNSNGISYDTLWRVEGGQVVLGVKPAIRWSVEAQMLFMRFVCWFTARPAVLTPRTLSIPVDTPDGETETYSTGTTKRTRRIPE